MSQNTSEFTFWPLQSEAEMIERYSPRDVSMLIHNNPDLMVACLHELWRKDQMEKMFESMKSLRETYGKDPFDLFQKNMATPLLLMCIGHDVPTDKASQFLKSVFEAALKSEMGFEFTQSLPEQVVQEVGGHVDRLMAPLKEIVRARHSSLN